MPELATCQVERQQAIVNVLQGVDAISFSVDGDPMGPNDRFALIEFRILPQHLAITIDRDQFVVMLNSLLKARIDVVEDE